jgi:hypothetical protein
MTSWLGTGKPLTFLQWVVTYIQHHLQHLPPFKMAIIFVDIFCVITVQFSKKIQAKKIFAQFFVNPT